MEKESTIIAIGLTVHNTPVEIREKLAVPEAEWPRAIAELTSFPHIEEAGVLSTCNRMELYVVALSQRRGTREVGAAMAPHHQPLPASGSRLQFAVAATIAHHGSRLVAEQRGVVRLQHCCAIDILALPARGAFLSAVGTPLTTPRLGDPCRLRSG